MDLINLFWYYPSPSEKRSFSQKRLQLSNSTLTTARTGCQKLVFAFAVSWSYQVIDWFIAMGNLKFVWIGILFGIVPISCEVYLNKWGVHIKGGSKVADQVAQEHGFQNLGQVS